MNTNTFTTSLAFAALVLLSSWDGNYYGVDASTEYNPTVTCLTEAPTICAGISYGVGPSPFMNGDTNTTTYMGGWKFTFDFMEGLEMYNGTILAEDVLAEVNATLLEVSVTIDDDGSCVIDVGSDTCSSCSTELCGFDDIANGDTDLPLSVTFDCTNVVNGRASLPEVCESVELYDGVFYPLVASMAKGEDTDASALDGLVVDDGSTSTSTITSTSSDGDASTSSSTTAASSTSTSTCGLLEEGTFPQDGIDCLAAMPAEQTTISCEMSRSFTLTQMDKSCTCDRSNPKWKCSTSTHASKENNDKDLDSIADVGGTMTAATTASSGNSAAVHYVAVMAVGVVGAVFTMTTL